jgi:hypothetical protein
VIEKAAFGLLFCFLLADARPTGTRISAYRLCVGSRFARNVLI